MVALIALALFGAVACATTGTTTSTSGGEVGPGPGTPDLSSAMQLVNELTNAVPQLTQAQTITGAGALLGLAKARLSDSQFSPIATALPGSQALLSVAQQSGLPSSTDVSSGASGATVLSKAGIPANLGKQLIPALGSAISSRVNPQVANAFLAAVSR